MKKIFIILVILSVSVTSYAQDVNGDGKFNLADVIASLKFITDQSDTICIEPADIDLNGKVDWYDFFLKSKSHKIIITDYYKNCLIKYDATCGDITLDGRKDFFDFLNVYNSNWSVFAKWYRDCYLPETIETKGNIIWDDNFFPDIVREFSPEIIDLKLSNTNMKSSIISLNSDIAVLNGDITDMSKEICDLQAERDKAVTDRDEFSNSLGIANDLVYSLQIDIDKINAERDKLKIERDQAIEALANPSISQIITELANLRVSNTTFEKSLNEANGRIDSLTRELSVEKSTVASVTAERDTAKSTIDTLNSSITKLNSDIASLNAEIAKAGGDIDALVKERDNLVISVTTANDTISKLNNTITTITSERDKAISDLATRTSERDTAIASLATANATIATLTSTLATRTAERDARIIKPLLNMRFEVNLNNGTQRIDNKIYTGDSGINFEGGICGQQVFFTDVLVNINTSQYMVKGVWYSNSGFITNYTGWINLPVTNKTFLLGMYTPYADGGYIDDISSVYILP